MRKYLNSNSRHGQLLLITTLLLASCSQSEDINSSENLGKSDAGFMSAEVHKAYLNCYPLSEPEKNTCLGELALKYISDKQKTDAKYIIAFRFEAEKLGFKRFLNSHDLACEELSGGPIFDTNANAYIVPCKPLGQYRMQFDYALKEWKLIK
jgi:hypothetical protein